METKQKNLQEPEIKLKRLDKAVINELVNESILLFILHMFTARPCFKQGRY